MNWIWNVKTSHIEKSVLKWTTQGDVIGPKANNGCRRYTSWCHWCIHVNDLFVVGSSYHNQCHVLCSRNPCRALYPWRILEKIWQANLWMNIIIVTYVWIVLHVLLSWCGHLFCCPCLYKAVTNAKFVNEQVSWLSSIVYK